MAPLGGLGGQPSVVDRQHLSLGEISIRHLLEAVMQGQADDLIAALLELDKQQRLENLCCLKPNDVAATRVHCWFRQ